ncbi:SAM-dependent methyltransferase [Actomonas aquatica]|uniref:SAM-dependent methyltransferase n=1 Tax=Actomonas aquatica TaxID=2866162 RepID=A0ABZ1CC33_9BACT|nr:SAM-dependent methyltransferase [Opitutus sp. WL0086]WRQ88955.1 SAM-dependent methyltransferase [Opitutus sp. WL0086]
MGSSSQPHPTTPHIATQLRARAAADGFIPFADFMDVALYDPQTGFYTADRERVGQSAGTHFYTATSLGPVFGELVSAAAQHHLQRHHADPAAYRFIEIGSERGRTVLDGIEHPFAELVPLGVGTELKLSGPCIVFSNELFDAQPCRRFLRSGDAWLERGVTLDAQNQLHETTRPVAPADAIALRLPADALDGYELDLPIAADALAATIASQPWHGLFLAFDYGKSWHELSHETPQGTVRAYHHHRQSNALYDHIGEQDLTCHICWDTLGEALQKAGFSVDSALSQEAFFIKNTASTLARIMAAEASTMSPRKAGLMQLLHPSALGQKFQALTAWRDEA